MDQIESRSRESGLGLSRTVIDMLLGKAVASELALHHEFDFLFGSMSKEEADEFNNLLKEQKQIDPEMWK